MIKKERKGGKGDHPSLAIFFDRYTFLLHNKAVVTLSYKKNITSCSCLHITFIFITKVVLTLLVIVIFVAIVDDKKIGRIVENQVHTLRTFLYFIFFQFVLFV